MSRYRALSALLRVERRDFVRHRGRAILIALLVSVPVAAMVGGSALLRISLQTLEERRVERLGQATLRLDGEASELADHLAAANGPIPCAWVQHATGRISALGAQVSARFVTVGAGALESGGLATGMVRLTEGSLPVGSGEVALSPAVQRALGCGIGDRVSLEGEADWIVRGSVVDPERLDMPLALRVAPPDEIRGVAALLVDASEVDTQAIRRSASAAGHRATAREEIAADVFEEVAVFVLGGFGFFEAALVIAAAFAVSLRRRQREIGLLGAAGASGGVLRVAMGGSALVLAMVGVCVGVGVGVAAARAAYPYLDAWNGRFNGPFEVPMEQVLGAAALGLFTGVAASAWPVRSAVRMPVLTALAGRRPSLKSARAWLVAGIVLFALGASLTALGARGEGNLAVLSILVGSATAVLGLGSLSSWVLAAMTRIASVLPLPWRLAVRDAGRARARNGPVVTAVLAAMALSVLLAAFFESIRPLAVGSLRDDVLIFEGANAELAARRMAEQIPCEARAPLLAVYSQGEVVRARHVSELEGQPSPRSNWIAFGTSELLRVLGVEASISKDSEHEVSSVLVLGELDPAKLERLELFAGEKRGLGSAPVEVLTPSQPVRSPGYVMNAAALAEFGLVTGPPPHEVLVPWWLRLSESVTREDVDRARALAGSLGATTVDAALLRVRPVRALLDVILLICAVTGLAVIFIATALSSVEAKSDARTLFTVGASPRVLCGHHAARAGYLALLGCCMAVPAGLTPFFGLRLLADLPLSFRVPWTALIVTVVGLPLAAYTGTWLYFLFRSPSDPSQVTAGVS